MGANGKGSAIRQMKKFDLWETNRSKLGGPHILCKSYGGDSQISALRSRARRGPTKFLGDLGEENF